MSTQDLRKRIKSVKNTQQITKAMKMVASARLIKAQQKALATTPYANKLQEILGHVMSSCGHVQYSLAKAREVKKTAYIVVGADKGLAGAFTTNVMKHVLNHLEGKSPDEYILITVGRKPRDIFKHRKYPVYKSFSGFSDKPEISNAWEIGQFVTDLYNSEEVDKVEIIYTHFINTITYDVRQEQIIPVQFETHKDFVSASYLFEPEEEVLVEELLPQYINFSIYHGLLQSCASELGSRMTAMTTASDNAGELIKTLDLQYNRLRQAQITNEISEIIGGANALS